LSGRTSSSGPLDLLVVGSGVAGLSAAVRAAAEHGLRTGIVTKGGLEQATTRWAQGGVAAALSTNPEEIDLHLADTLAAGAGLCDVEATRVLVDEGPRRVEELIALGAEFDRDAAGNLELAREGGHSVARVVHAGGSATGAEIERALVQSVRASAVVIHEETFVRDLVVTDGTCTGVVCISRDGVAHEVAARHVLLAAGGAGQLFSVTTNPLEATGDGVAAAFRAGAAVADLEFFQFHPTALHHSVSPRPLLTEALRGHGAVLRNVHGDRFVDELLPRDVVSRAILNQMRIDRTSNVWLDATALESFDQRFPNIAAVLSAAGLDASSDLLPVHPAAHHLCGGVLTDLDGATTLPGLWACGEVACTGVHGANRLASNSLLEGMVFAPRTVEAILGGRNGPVASGALAPLLSDGGDGGHPADTPGAGHIPVTAIDLLGSEGGSAGGASVPEVRRILSEAMTRGAGVERSGDSLRSVLSVIADTEAWLGSNPEPTVGYAELCNLSLVSRALVSSALEREESRGTHWRRDFTASSPDGVKRLRPMDQ
jgi:L-aspartate oxidase